MNLRVLVIDARIGAVVAIKQALEQTGNFQVYPFADAYAALDFLSEKHMDVVVADMHLSDYPGIDLIESIRLAQEDVTVIASTSDSTVASRAVSAGAAGLVQTNYNARELLGTVQQMLSQSSAEQLPVQPSEPTVSDEATAVFEKLAAEEPPLPGFRQGGTITNFMARVSDNELNNLLNAINDAMDIDSAPIAEPEPDIEEGDTEPDTPAHFILEDALGASIPLDESPFEQYLERIRGDRSRDEAAEYVDEPDFLDDIVDVPFRDQFNETTQASRAELRRMQEDEDRADTPPLEDETPLDDTGSQQTADFKPPTIPPEDLPAMPDEDTGSQQTADFKPPIIPPEDLPETPPAIPEDEEVPLFADAADEADKADEADETDGEAAALKTDAESDHDDPRIAQMAVSLTQASLESAATAILLLRAGEVLAYEGALSDADIEHVMATINEDEVEQKKARIQFTTLEGMDFLIYSRRTEDDLILSMVCEGGTSMTEIRTQARRLLAALASVPHPPTDAPAEPEAAEPDAPPTKPSRGGMRLVASADATPGLLTKYTFLWVPRDPNFALEYEMAETIDAGMRTQLAEQGWKIDFLEVQEDYLYIVAGVPGDTPPQQHIRKLQRLSAEIAATLNPDLDPATLWADSYFVLAPGRQLNVQEIQQYINFHRV